MIETGITRRQFLHRAGLSAAAVGAGAFAGAVAPYGRPAARVSANDRLVLGFIGVGGMGRSHFDRLLHSPRAHVAAAADVDAQRLAAAGRRAKAAGGSIAMYRDFREMLERTDLDAVFVSTPDHWHALASIAVMKSGRDVYCEKPLALTIAEGRAMVETARALGRVCQMGAQQRSDWWFRDACALAADGSIGELRRVVCFFTANPRHDPVADAAPPAYLDWDLWLGPAPRRAFNPCIHPYGFRHFRDYSGGLLADWGAHLLDVAQWGCGKDATGPRRIEAEGRMWTGPNQYDFPRSLRVEYDYGDVVVEWRQDPAETVEAGHSYGTLFLGSDGELFVNREGYRIRARSGALPRAATPPAERLSHHDDFFEAVRTRRAPASDVAIGHRSTSLAHLGNIAFDLGRPLRYDPAAERFLDDPVADARLSRAMRAPWRV